MGLMAKFGTLDAQEVRILRYSLSTFLAQTTDAMNYMQEHEDFQERWGTEGAERAMSAFRSNAECAQSLLDSL